MKFPRAFALFASMDQKTRWIRRLVGASLVSLLSVVFVWWLRVYCRRIQSRATKQVQDGQAQAGVIWNDEFGAVWSKCSIDIHDGSYLQPNRQKYIHWLTAGQHHVGNGTTQETYHDD
jgi:hypothetical protein